MPSYKNLHMPHTATFPKMLAYIIFLVCWLPQRNLVPSFFLSSIFLFTIYMYNFMWFIKFRALVGMCGVCTRVHRCAWVCRGLHRFAQVYSGVHGFVCGGGGGLCGGMFRCIWYAWVCMGMCGSVWDEFSEYILETWVITSADFNTYLIRIFKKRFSLVFKRRNIFGIGICLFSKLGLDSDRPYLLGTYECINSSQNQYIEFINKEVSAVTRLMLVSHNT